MNRILLRLFVLFLGGLGHIAFAHGDSLPHDLNDDWLNRQLRFTIQLSNPSAETLYGQTLWAYLPISNYGSQKLESVKVSVPYRAQTDESGHNLLQLDFPQFEPLASKVVNLVVDVLVKRSPTPEALHNPQDWLKAERFIEINDPRIRALAQQLKRHGEHDTAKAIYEWTRKNLRYAGYVADDKGALDALLRREGDCTEYAFLVVALARSNQIPARMVGGYVIDKSGTPRPMDYHNWAEVYFDGAWRLVDAQKGYWLKGQGQYIAFRYYRDEAINPIGLAHRYKLQGALQVNF